MNIYQYKKFDVLQFDILDSNFGYLITDKSQTKAIAIDPGCYDAYEEILTSQNLQLKEIYNTHHHYDHIDANKPLAVKYSANIKASLYDVESSRIPFAEFSPQGLSAGDKLDIFGAWFEVMEISGHTDGHIAFFCEDEKVLFVGDTLFGHGCGRLFEGTADQLAHSLKSIMLLPDETQVFCAHEYTLNNLKFALSVYPDDSILLNDLKRVETLAKSSKPTVPFKLGKEKARNIFLRALLRDDLVEFKKLRKLRDQW